MITMKRNKEYTVVWKRISKVLGAEKWKDEKSGTTITQQSNRSGGKEYGISYKVYIPKAHAGKVIRKNFITEEKAKEFARITLEKIKRAGTDAATELTIDQTKEAVRMYQLLAPVGATLEDVVTEGLKVWKRKNKAVLLSEAIPAFLEYKRTLKIKKKTETGISNAMKRLLEGVGDKNVVDITTEEILHHMDTNLAHYEDGTRNTEIGHYVNLFQWCIKIRRYILADDNPMTPIKKRKVKHKKTILTIDQIKRLLTPALERNGKFDGYHILYHVIQLYVGLRPEEIHSRAKDKDHLRWSDINMETGRIDLRDDVCKTDDDWFDKTLPANALEFIRPYYKDTDEKIIPYSRYDRKIAEYRKELGFGNWSDKYHDALRHTFASFHFRLHNYNIEKTKEAMSHKPETKTLERHYLRATSEEAAQEFAILTPEYLLKK